MIFKTVATGIEGESRIMMYRDSSDAFPVAHCVLRRVNRHVVFSCQLEVNERGKGYAAILDEEKVRVARSHGYRLMLATVRTDNAAQFSAMRKVRPEWRLACQVNSEVNLYYRILAWEKRTGSAGRIPSEA